MSEEKQNDGLPEGEIQEEDRELNSVKSDETLSSAASDSSDYDQEIMRNMFFSICAEYIKPIGIFLRKLLQGKFGDHEYQLEGIRLMRGTL